jgi:hypothetical protein
VSFNHAPDKVCIRVADITAEVFSRDPSLKIALEEDIQSFSVPAANPDLSIEAAWRMLDSGRSGRKVFDSGGSWQLYLEDDEYCFHCTAPVMGTVPYAIARLSRDFKCGQVLLHQPFFEHHQAVYPLQYPLDELLFLKLLSQGKGVEVHACGIIDVNGDGRLFVGHSGAGKTTMARLWEKEQGITILSDDRIILKQEEESVWMYGTPWHGEAELASAARAPLKQIYFISHGRENSLKFKNGAEAAAILFACSFPVFYSHDGLEFTIDFLGRIANTIPCNELNVVPNSKIVDFVRREQ